MIATINGRTLCIINSNPNLSKGPQRLGVAWLCAKLYMSTKPEVEPLQLFNDDPRYEDAIGDGRVRYSFRAQNLKASILGGEAPRLEEYFESPAYSSSVVSGLSRQKLAKLREYKIPVTEDQIEDALSSEFHDRLMKTPWDEYRCARPSEAEAAKLIQEKIIWDSLQKTNSKVDKKTPVDQNQILHECTRMLHECTTGSYDRHIPKVTPQLLEGKNLSEESISTLDSAASALGRNPTMHPSMKSYSLSIIADVLSTGPSGQ